MFSGDENSGMVEIRLKASGFSQIPYEVIVVPRQSDPPMALGTYVFTHLDAFLVNNVFKWYARITKSFLNQVCAGLQLACAWFLEIIFVRLSVCLCLVYVCPHGHK